MRHVRSAWMVAMALLIGASGFARPAEDAPSAASRLASMKEVAKAVMLFPAASGKRSELIPDSIYRFDDPARSFSDGTIWIYGKMGRPAALLCLSLAKDPQGQANWVHELTSLNDGPIDANSRHASGSWTWNPKEPGLKFLAVPKAPAPVDDDSKRLRQLKEISRRFRAFESLDPIHNDPADRFELRLMPQPIHRYQDQTSGLVDGAIFLLSYGRNPELAIVIEARREGSAEPTWVYGLTRLSAARIRVSLDDREVADLPKPVDAGSKSTYFLFDRPALGLKD